MKIIIAILGLALGMVAGWVLDDAKAGTRSAEQRLIDLEMRAYRLESWASEKTTEIHQPATPSGYDEWHRAQRRTGR